MRQALEMALEALEDRASLMKWQKARDAVKEALAHPELKDEKGRPMTYWGGMAQPEPEAAPVAKNESGRITWLIDDWPQNCLLYTHTPQRTWVGLTWEEIDECFKITPDQYLPAQIYRRIEAKIKEKNT